MRRDLVSPLFVGREAELATLTAALEAAVDGTPTVVLLGGEAGVGKTGRRSLEPADRRGAVHHAQDGERPRVDILGKLGVASRGEATAMAHRLRAPGPAA